MATQTYLVKIGTTELQNLKSFTVERNKLWTDADRNLNGDLKATFVGVFPKLVLEFGYLTEAELKANVTLLDDPSFTVSWWDSEKTDYSSGSFYAGDFGYPLFDKEKGRYSPFKVSLIPYSKLS